MKNLAKVSTLVAGLLVAGAASAANMYINVPGYDYTAGSHVADANTTTGLFNEFGFSQLLATSVYDLTDGSVMGSFYDTNYNLGALGLPTSGTPMSGTGTVSLSLPTAAQIDLDALSPLVPPLSGDSEGFLFTWGLNILYKFNGTLTASGPVYTGGTFEVWFDDYNNNANDRKVISGILTGSQLQAANLNLFLTITYAEANFLFVEDSNGNYRDASTGDVPLVLDTNVNPPIPTPDQLLQVGTNAIRQTTLDGSITAAIPEPGSAALIGLGLLGVGALRRRRAS